MREKLNSQRGASLLIALLYFLVCGLVAAVIIGAAMTNVQKLKGAHQRQQAYNSVSSAAQLIRDEMTRVEYQGMERWPEREGVPLSHGDHRGGRPAHPLRRLVRLRHRSRGGTGG